MGSQDRASPGFGFFALPALIALAVVLGAVVLGVAAAAEATVLRLPDPPPPGAWVEVTDLRSAAPSELVRFPEGEGRAETEVPPGLALVCASAEEHPVVCEQRFLPSDEELALEFPRGAAVVGSCLEAGEPAAGAEVSVVPRGLRTRRPFTVPLELEGEELERKIPTDEDGRFRLPELAPGTYQVEVRFPSGHQLHSEPFTVQEPAPRRPGAEEAGRAPVAVLDLGRLEVQAGESVQFFVTDLDGRPIEGALVGGGQGDRPENLASFEGRTDAEGRSTVSGFRADLPVRLACRAQGYAGDASRFEVVPAVHECRLTPLVNVRGRVLDGREEPLEGATVSVEGARVRASTGEDGNYELAGLAPQGWTLRVAAPGFEVEEVPVELAPGERLRELEPVVLEPASQVFGQVVDGATEAPVAGAEVVITDPPGLGSTTSDADGAFVLEAGAPGGLGLRVSHPGYAPLDERVLAADLESGEEVVLELSHGGRILVQVWDEEAGGPCVGCEVWLSGAGRDRLHTDGEGRVVTELLAPGSYNVQRPRGQMLGSRVVVEGGRGSKRVEVRAGETTRVELGEPVVTQVLDLAPPPPPGWTLTGRSATRTDSYRPSPSGRVELRRRPGEPLTLHLSASGLHGPTVRLGGLPPVDRSGRESLRLPETMLVGAVLRSEGPAANTPLALVSAEDGRVWGSVHTDHEGRFAVPFLAPGIYLLRVGDRVARTVVMGRAERRDLGTLRVP